MGRRTTALLLLLALQLPGAALEARGFGLRHWLLPRREKVVRLPAQRPTPAVSVPRIARLPLALLPGGRSIAPSSFIGGFHGTDQISPEVALRDGLPARGDDWRLQEHAEGVSGRRSAFRGTTTVASDPLTGNGAAYWAGAGGWVYEVRGVPSWDVNVLLEGRVARPTGYRGNLMCGEQEIAIPARVPAERIKAYGQVEADAFGRLFVRRWIPNPAYRPAEECSVRSGRTTAVEAPPN